MRRTVLGITMVAVFTAVGTAQQPQIQPQTAVDPATARFDAVLKQSLAALARAKAYSVDVDSKWNATADSHGAQAGSHYRLTSEGGRYRVEIQSVASQAPELVCVNDGKSVTTYYP